MMNRIPDGEDLDAEILNWLARTPDAPTPSSQACTSATALWPRNLSSEQMLRQIEDALAAVPPEPIGEWMRAQGYPPAVSTLVLPESMRAAVGPWPPKYVVFSDRLPGGGPVLLRGRFDFGLWAPEMKL